MKKFLLSALVSLASYTGSYASNEVVNSTLISEEIEMKNIEAMNFEFFKLDKLTFEFGNCVTHVRVIEPDGSQSDFVLSTNTDNSADCVARGLRFGQELESMGYQITNYHNYWNMGE